jgi:hypothetical protein
VHPGEGGWTARDILTHLAARQRGHDMLFQMATGGTSPFTGEFDVDSWNRGLIDERAGRSRDELLQEFRTTHEALIERVQQTPEEQLNATIQSPRGPITAGDMLMNSGGLHSTAHADEVANALGIG